MIKRKMIQAHLRAAQGYADTSYAKRLQVGAVIVNQLTDQPVSAGWNGMPPGVPNICEDEVDGVMVSKDNVVHAEINALKNIPKKLPHQFLTIFVTDSPCPVCAQKIVESGIKQVIFSRRYRLDGGISILLHEGVEVFHGSDVQLKLDDKGLVKEYPAEYSPENILLCRNYRSSTKARPHGLLKHWEMWSDREREMLYEMFWEGKSADEISSALDRSLSSVCTLLSRKGYVSWADNRGYMASEKGKRFLWCSQADITNNKRAIETAVKKLEPEVRLFIESNKGCKADEVYNAFPTLARYFLNKIINSIKEK